MPPRLPLRSVGRRNALLRAPAVSEARPVCFFCSLGATTNPESTRRSRKRVVSGRRFESTAAGVASRASQTSDPRKELEIILLELKKHAASYVNLSRVQLALNGLRQKQGTEAIRVAILGLTNGSESSKAAKDVLKLLLADPLKEEQKWEGEIDSHNLAQPMIIRVGAENPHDHAALSLSQGGLLHEVHVSSAVLNGHNIELLLMETNPFMPAQDSAAAEAFEQSVLVPTVDIPTSNTGRYTPITTPVHKALVVADGFMGAASVASMPLLEMESTVAATVNLPDYKPTDVAALPFTPIDTQVAKSGLGLVRKDIGKAIEFEHLWYQSNLPKLFDWLKADILTSPKNETKPPVKLLIASILDGASAAIQKEESREMGAKLSAQAAQIPSTPPQKLQSQLADWAESAHSELQQQLDFAFSSGRWRKLSWWKLFWRVDDVAMLTTDILNQRFLPKSERSAIFLAGRMKEAGVPLRTPTDGQTKTDVIAEPEWPVNIPNSRSFLQTEKIPALQAMAQNLMVQTLSTSGLTTSLGALAYFGTLTTGIYEAGAVAALGIVWSMRRMQNKWEAAREYWEGEVREEGRKAVRGVEMTIQEALTGRDAKEDEVEEEVQDQEHTQLVEARELVQRGQDALARLK